MTGFAEIAAAGPVLLALGVCVLAGLVSFASPCVVPLVPGYLSYLAAVVGVEEGTRGWGTSARGGERSDRGGLTDRSRCGRRGCGSPARRGCSSPGSPRCSCSAPSRCWA